MVTDRLQSEMAMQGTSQNWSNLSLPDGYVAPSSPEPCFPGIQMGLSENRPLDPWLISQDFPMNIARKWGIQYAQFLDKAPYHIKLVCYIHLIFL